MAQAHAKTYKGRLNYPFSAIWSQEKLKLALLLNVINPDRGSADSRRTGECKDHSGKGALRNPP